MAVSKSLPKYKVVIVGDENVGKTNIITRFTLNTFDTTYKPTVGIDFVSKTMYRKDKPILRLQLWDTAGESRFRCFIPGYIKDSTIVMIVYDVTNRQSFLNTSTWIEEVRKVCTDSMIVLVANKCDVVDKRQVAIEEGDDKARELGFMFIETSAKDGLNNKLLFQKIASALFRMESCAPKKHENNVDVNFQYSDGGLDTTSFSNTSYTQQVTHDEHKIKERDNEEKSYMEDKRCWSILEKMMKDMLKKMDEMQESNRMVKEMVKKYRKVYDERYEDMLTIMEEMHAVNMRVEEKVKECRTVYDKRCEDMLNKMEDMLKRMEEIKNVEG